LKLGRTALRAAGYDADREEIPTMPNEARAVQHRSIGRESVIVAKGDLLCCEVERELILLDATSGTYFGLNAVGSRIWALVQEPTTMANAYEALLKDFDVDKAECEAELYRFVIELESKGLVEIRS
jgi:hypothetical protein